MSLWNKRWGNLQFTIDNLQSVGGLRCVAPRVTNDRADNCGEFARFLGERRGFSLCTELTPIGNPETKERLTGFFQRDRALRNEVATALAATSFFKVCSD